MRGTVWPYKVERQNGIATKVVMTNNIVAIPFVIGPSGKIVEMSDYKIRLDGATTRSPERLWMPPAHYKQALMMAVAILREGRRQKRAGRE